MAKASTLAKPKAAKPKPAKAKATKAKAVPAKAMKGPAKPKAAARAAPTPAPAALARKVKLLEKRVLALEDVLKRFLLKPESGPDIYAAVFTDGDDGEGDGPGGD